MPIGPGTRLGPYEIISELGAGGMGQVFRARDTRLNRNVAVKVLPASLSSAPEMRARLEQEARTASSFNHPNIVSVFDVGETEGTFYLVEELLEGETLRERLSFGAVPGSRRSTMRCKWRGVSRRRMRAASFIATSNRRISL